PMPGIQTEDWVAPGGLGTIFARADPGGRPYERCGACRAAGRPPRGQQLWLPAAHPNALQWPKVGAKKGGGMTTLARQLWRSVGRRQPGLLAAVTAIVGISLSFAGYVLIRSSDPSPAAEAGWPEVQREPTAH